MRLRFTTQIDAPREWVWPYLAEDANLSLWMTDVAEIRYPDGQGDPAAPVGVRFRRLMRERQGNIWYDGEITLFEPPRMLGVRIWADQSSSDVLYHLERKSGGTELDYLAEITLKSRLSTMLSAFAWPMAHRTAKRHMRNLKDLAEGGFQHEG